MKTIITFLALILCTKSGAQFISTLSGNGATGMGKGSFSGDNGLAGAANLADPYKICLDAAGNIYFADCSNHRVRKISVNGIISTIAGNGSAGFSGDGGFAISAELQFPSSVCLDASGNIYISDLGNNRIRKVNTAGIITTIAGTGATGFGNGTYSGDGGPAIFAALNAPISMIVDATGNVLIADSYNHRIRKVGTTGTITTIAGIGTGSYSGDGGQASAAELHQPSDLIHDAAGNLLIADNLNHRIRKIDAVGIITTIAGTGSPAFSGDGGPAVNAGLNNPNDVDRDAAGNIYITDMYNHCIRKIDGNGIITSIAGTGSFGYSGDGGPAVSANLFLPGGIALYNNNVYIADQLNQRIRMICNNVVSVSLSTSPATICAGNSAVLTASGASTYTYSWNTAETGTNTLHVSPSASKSYYAQGKDMNGCVGYSSVAVTVDPCVGVEEPSTKDQAKLYPNPAVSELHIRDNRFSQTSSRITVINSLGQVVRSIQTSEIPNNAYTIDITDLQNGVYFLRIENGASITTKRFNKID